MNKLSILSLLVLISCSSINNSSQENSRLNRDPSAGQDCNSLINAIIAAPAVESEKINLALKELEQAMVVDTEKYQDYLELIRKGVNPKGDVSELSFDTRKKLLAILRSVTPSDIDERVVLLTNLFENDRSVLNKLDFTADSDIFTSELVRGPIIANSALYDKAKREHFIEVLAKYAKKEISTSLSAHDLSLLKNEQSERLKKLRELLPELEASIEKDYTLSANKKLQMQTIKKFRAILEEAIPKKLQDRYVMLSKLLGETGGVMDDLYFSSSTERIASDLVSTLDRRGSLEAKESRIQILDSLARILVTEKVFILTNDELLAITAQRMTDLKNVRSLIITSDLNPAKRAKLMKVFATEFRLKTDSERMGLLRKLLGEENSVSGRVPGEATPNQFAIGLISAIESDGDNQKFIKLIDGMIEDLKTTW